MKVSSPYGAIKGLDEFLFKALTQHLEHCQCHICWLLLFLFEALEICVPFA